jgi:SSS family solute:Na+ symporter
MPMITFFVYISLNWWATWYPGAEPGGGGYIAQRMFCAKDEKNSLLATLWFNVAHYAVRPWPWILVALASLILFPGLQDPETGYIRVMIAHLPPSLRGLMVAAFAAAYMSTIATQLNWGASYLVNDFYRRFVKRGAGDRHYVFVSKVATVLLMIISAAVSLRLESISGAWKLVIAAGAGTGSVYLLRWYWWRINAWSEIAAMAAALVSALAVDYRFQCFTGRDVPATLFSKGMLAVVAITTVVWLLATFLTAPEPREVLVSFYRRVRPSYAFWKPIARLAPEVPPVHDVWYNLGDFIAGCVLVYGAMFGIGKTLLGFFGQGIFYLALAVIASGYIWWDFSRRGWEALAGEASGKAKRV